MHKEAERIYMDLLVMIGRAGVNCNLYVVWSNKKNRFLIIREWDYRAEMVGTDAYELIGTYNGKEDLPRYSEIAEDICAFIQQETEKKYGCRPELEKLMQTG